MATIAPLLILILLIVFCYFFIKWLKKKYHYELEGYEFYFSDGEDLYEYDWNQFHEQVVKETFDTLTLEEAGILIGILHHFDITLSQAAQHLSKRATNVSPIIFESKILGLEKITEIVSKLYNYLESNLLKHYREIFKLCWKSEQFNTLFKAIESHRFVGKLVLANVNQDWEKDISLQEQVLKDMISNVTMQEAVIIVGMFYNYEIRLNDEHGIESAIDGSTPILPLEFDESCRIVSVQFNINNYRLQEEYHRCWSFLKTSFELDKIKGIFKKHILISEFILYQKSL